MAAILIADDDPIVRLVAAELLSGGEHAIVEADDGVTAMRVIEAVPIDLVILDMLMPNMDGLEVIKAVRTRFPHIKILAISAGGRGEAQGYLQAAKAFGADETISKPLSLPSFAQAVDRVLNQPRSAVGFGGARAQHA